MLSSKDETEILAHELEKLNKNVTTENVDPEFAKPILKDSVPHSAIVRDPITGELTSPTYDKTSYPQPDVKFRPPMECGLV